jgi:D-proline reductase (dithiol) PrdB
MARLDRLPEPMRSHIATLECPTFKTQPWVVGPSLNQRRVAIVSTAGLHLRDDRPFTFGSGDYRVIPGDIATNDLVMSHISTNFDRTGFGNRMSSSLTDFASWPQALVAVSPFPPYMGATDPRNGANGATRSSPGKVLRLSSVDAALLASPHIFEEGLPTADQRSVNTEDNKALDLWVPFE